MNHRRTMILACLAILLSGCLIQIFMGQCGESASVDAWGIDDSYISYRYSFNFAHGQGLCFNPGERVEGYSNFLYVLMISPIFLVAGKDAAYPLSETINIILIVVAFLIFRRYMEQQFGAKKALLASLLFALAPSIWVAIASGMETALVLLVQICIWISTERLLENEDRNGVLALIAFSSISILARADGFIMPALACLLLLLKGRTRIAIYSGSAIVIIGTAYFAWRFSYYGYLFPNAYYAKVEVALFPRLRSAVRSLLRIGAFYGFLPYYLILIWQPFRGLMKTISKKALSFKNIDSAVFFGLSWMMYWIYIGGDIFRDRFLLILIPLGIAIFLRHIWPLLSSKMLVSSIAVLIFFQLIPLYANPRFQYTFKKYDCWIELGKFLERGDKTRILAIDAAGKVPFFSGLRSIDMLGLNDIYLAHKQERQFFMPGHNKYDADYILSKEPDIICALIENDLNLFWGLQREKYEKAGYRLQYLVNSSRRLYRDNIVDVASASQDSIGHLMELGFKYAVLEKNK